MLLQNEYNTCFSCATALCSKVQDNVATLEKPAVLGMVPFFSQGTSYFEKNERRKSEIWTTSQPAVTLNSGFQTERTGGADRPRFWISTARTSPILFCYLIIIWRGQRPISPLRARTHADTRGHAADIPETQVLGLGPGWIEWCYCRLFFQRYHWIGTGCQDIPDTVITFMRLSKTLDNA